MEDHGLNKLKPLVIWGNNTFIITFANKKIALITINQVESISTTKTLG
jgi:hypothetical protein